VVVTGSDHSCYQWAGDSFWWYVWILVFLVSLLMNMFMPRLLCHFFNKQVPLRKVRPKPNQNHAEGVGFQLEKIFVID
jgi:STE24 endopeptidase